MSARQFFNVLYLSGHFFQFKVSCVDKSHRNYINFAVKPKSIWVTSKISLFLQFKLIFLLLLHMEFVCDPLAPFVIMNLWEWPQIRGQLSLLRMNSGVNQLPLQSQLESSSWTLFASWKKTPPFSREKSNKQVPIFCFWRYHLQIY